MLHSHEQQAAERRRAALAAYAAETLQLGAVQELLVELAPSSLGRRAVMELEPLPDDEVRAAMARLREVQLLERVGDLPSMGGVCDPLPLLEAARRGTLDEGGLSRLRDFLSASERLAHWLETRASDLPELGRVGRALPDLSILREAFDAVLDERGAIRDDASPLLARLRQEERELARRIDGTLRAVAARPEVRGLLNDGRAHLRGGRPCLAVKSKSSGRIPGIVHEHSQSEQTAFVEPREVIELANRQAECRLEERREAARLASELARAVGRAAPELRAAADALARVELAFVAARYCRQQGARAPALPGEKGAEQGLVLRSARHPLLLRELSAGRLAEVVPIDLRLGGEFDMLILTGPNTGGKTLALETAGLACLMVRLGMPVPCEEGSRVPLYSGIAADIGDEQEISQSLSTFSSHLRRIRAGLERAGPATLVLLDELGGGTDPDEGAALGEAILEELLRLGAPTLVSTHLGRLKEFAFRHARAENACTEFDLATLAPRYRVLVGTPGDSAALVIARRLGLPAEVVEAAEARLERRDEELAALMDELRDVRSQAEEKRAQAESRLAEAEREQQALAGLRGELERRGELLEAEAQQGLEERLRAARQALERAERLTAQLPPQQRAQLEQSLAVLRSALVDASLTERRKAFLERLKKGELVYLPRYRRRAPVQRVDHDKRELTVKIGGMKLTVPFDEVTIYEGL